MLFFFYDKKSTIYSWQISPNIILQKFCSAPNSTPTRIQTQNRPKQSPKPDHPIAQTHLHTSPSYRSTLGVSTPHRPHTRPKESNATQMKHLLFIPTPTYLYPNLYTRKIFIFSYGKNLLCHSQQTSPDTILHNIGFAPKPTPTRTQTQTHPKQAPKLDHSILRTHLQTPVTHSPTQLHDRPLWDIVPISQETGRYSPHS